MNKVEAKITASDILALILFLILLSVPTYFAYTILFPRVEIFDTETEEEEEKDEEEIKVDIYDTPHYEEIYR